MNKNKIPPTGEEKALVYQKALELSPLMAPIGGPIAVIFEKTKKLKKTHYSVAFVLAPHSLNIKVKAEGENLLDVLSQVKTQAQKTLQTMAHFMESPVRSLKVEHFKKYPYLQ